MYLLPTSSLLPPPNVYHSDTNTICGRTKTPPLMRTSKISLISDIPGKIESAKIFHQSHYSLRIKMHKMISVAYFVELPNQTRKCMTYLPKKTHH